MEIGADAILRRGFLAIRGREAANGWAVLAPLLVAQWLARVNIAFDNYV